MDKVKLPKEVAEIIEDFRKAKISDGDIVRMSMRIFEGCSKERSALKEYSDSNLDDLINALKFGYEVEMTPEEKVFEYYYEHTENSDEKVGVCRTLNFLGIKIKGVNA